MTIRIDEEYLRDNYKEIQKACYSDGVLIPLLIDREAYDSYIGYRFDDDEKEPLFNRQNTIIMNKLEQNMINRRKDVYNILQNIDPNYDDLNAYKEDELKEWCREYFQFKGVYTLI